MGAVNILQLVIRSFKFINIITLSCICSVKVPQLATVSTWIKLRFELDIVAHTSNLAHGPFVQTLQKNKNK